MVWIKRYVRRSKINANGSVRLKISFVLSSISLVAIATKLINFDNLSFYFAYFKK